MKISYASRAMTPRHYVVRDYPERGVRSAQEQYSYSYTNSSSRTGSDAYGRPQSTSYTNESRVKRESGPYGNYTTERTSRTSSSGDGPGGYRSSYESTTSGRLPGGTTYRHFSYRV
ncbi:hypothetical protein TKK_0006037 [Trichogramma kaykai]